MSTSRMTGLESAVSLSTRQLVFARVVLSKQLDLEALGRLLENALRALALLENRLDGRPCADCDPDGRSELHGHLVDHREIGRIRDDDDQRLTVASVRDEPVAQHEVGGNRPEELVIDAELAEIDEFEPVALGQPRGRWTSPSARSAGVVSRPPDG